MKLRIVSGSLGGRQLDAPSGNTTHPMSERIRGAVFNILGDIEGLTVLDAFAGSGALSFEALSRGASCALMIELDQNAFNIAKENAISLGLENQTEIIRGNIKGWSNINQTRQFDIVFCDPPYDAVLGLLIEKIARHVAEKGVLVLSWPTHVEIPPLPNMQIVQKKAYGNATLVFYSKTG